MKNRFSGRALLIDRSDINTDEIIPAKYLSEISKEALRPYLFEDLSLDNGHEKIDFGQYNVVIARENFGCGSSREHAVWALEVNEIYTVIAESFSRIFRQNMFNCGLLAIELGSDAMDRIFSIASDGDLLVSTDLKMNEISITTQLRKEKFAFKIGSFEKKLLDAGGWVDYADKAY